MSGVFGSAGQWKLYTIVRIHNHSTLPNRYAATYVLPPQLVGWYTGNCPPLLYLLATAGWLQRRSEKDAKLARKLGRLQPFIAVFARESADVRPPPPSARAGRRTEPRPLTLATGGTVISTETDSNGSKIAVKIL